MRAILPLIVLSLFGASPVFALTGGGAKSVDLDEQSSVPGGAPAAGKGKIWIRDDAPNVLVYTDDGGTDTVLGAAVAIDGTANQVIVTPDGDGTITLSTPQDIDTTASPTFDSLMLTAAGTQDVTIETQQNDLVIGGGTTTTDFKLELFAFDNDGSDDVALTIDALGKSGEANTEDLWMGWDSTSTRFEIRTEQTGSGVARNLAFETAGNADQLVLSTGGNVSLSNLTASRLIASDGSKNLASVADLTTWIGGTANQISVADDGDGTLTLSTPQDIATTSTPTFAGGTFTGNVDIDTNRLILDDDQDTYIESTTDDEITITLGDVEQASVTLVSAAESSADLHFNDGTSNNGTINFLHEVPTFTFEISGSQYMSLGDGFVTFRDNAATSNVMILGGDINSCVSEIRFSGGGEINYDAGTDDMALETAGTERMRIDSGGHIGLGATPSAWGSGFLGVDFAANGALFGNATLNQGIHFVRNAYYDGTNYRYKLNGLAGRASMGDNFEVGLAASGTAGGTVTFTERFRVEQSTGDTYTNDGTVSSLSDVSMKRNVEDLDSVLSKISSLKPRKYEFKFEPQGRRHIGFIAQEVEGVFPELVKTTDWNDKQVKAIKHAWGPIVIKGMQEMIARNEALQARIAALETQSANTNGWALGGAVLAALAAGTYARRRKQRKNQNEAA